MLSRAKDLPPLPTVPLPAELAELLRKREERWRNLETLKELYTPEALVLGIRTAAWFRGDAAGAQSVGWVGGPLLRPYRLAPVSCRVGGSTASLAGYYTDAPNGSVLGFFHIDAERDDAGTWRIALEMPSFAERSTEAPLLADELVSLLDEAGMLKAVVLSNAYCFDGLLPVPGDELANMRAENDWTAEQVGRHPDRLVAFCSFNPTRKHAVAELERCTKNPAFKGVKLHFGTSPVDLDDPAHVRETRRVFEAANAVGWPILVHLAASPEWSDGTRQAEVFLHQLVGAAPDVQVVVAHLWGGAGYAGAALDLFAEAVSGGDPAAKNLYFEVSQAPLVTRGSKPIMERVARQVRRIGLDRLYYGSDGARPPGVSPKESWELFRTHLPLTDAEFQALAENVAPWVD